MSFGFLRLIGAYFNALLALILFLWAVAFSVKNHIKASFRAPRF
tara:strand:+ start:317 stop:448 length:132 start_codon:yes stop_codon:yes gene_type:complete